MTTRLQTLEQMGISFTQPELPEPGALGDEIGQEQERKRRRMVKQCWQIYDAAWKQVDQFADYVDQVNNLQPQPFERMELSDNFRKQYFDVMTEMETEAGRAIPDLEVFERLVKQWVEICLTELRGQVDKMRPVEG